MSIDVKEIWRQVKENQKKLDGCNKYWYEKGLEHANE